MNEKPIGVGDLVICVKKTPCCQRGKLGFIGRVIVIEYDTRCCSQCGRVSTVLGIVLENGKHFTLSRFKKLDAPLTNTDITAFKELRV